MTDGTTEVAQAATLDDSNANADANGSPADANAASPFAGLEPSLLEMLSKAGITDQNTLATEFGKKEQFIQSTVRFPGMDDKDKLAAFDAKVRPETAADYQMPEITDFPEDVPLQEPQIEALREISHGLGLRQDQFEGIVSQVLNHDAFSPTKAVEEAADARASAAVQGIQGAYGGKDTEEYNAAVSQVNSAYEAFPELGEVFKEVGLMDADGGVLDKRVFDILHKISGAGQIQAKGGMEKNASSTGDTGIDPKSGQITNATLASELFARDPETYRRLTKVTA